MKRPHVLAASALLWQVCAASAAQCGLSTQGVSFGVYDPFAASSLDSAGEITVTCDAPATYRISLSPGGGTFNARAMQNGGVPLYYNLYVDFSRATIWGDGTAGTATVSGSAANVAHVSVYGRMPARQNAAVGSYSDVLTVIVEF